MSRRLERGSQNPHSSCEKISLKANGTRFAQLDEEGLAGYHKISDLIDVFAVAIWSFLVGGMSSKGALTFWASQKKTISYDERTAYVRTNFDWFSQVRLFRGNISGALECY
jgi:hypothetical protein